MRKNTKTRAAAIVLILAMALSLTACGHEHTWTDSTCTEPKTCSECGKTDGEALGHSWVDATCAAPKTCSVCKETEGETLPHTWVEATCSAPKTCSECGETEGEALPHTLTEANFQTPATCTVCGATEGDVLTPDFVTHNIQLAELGKTYDYVWPTGNPDYTTVAHISVSDYQIFESNDTYPAKEGYEYRQATFTLYYDDENANKYGVGGRSGCLEDYYDIEFHDDSVVHDEDAGTSTYRLNFNGQEMEEQAVFFENEWDPWMGNTVTGRATLTVSVPVGYDGFVFGIRHADIEWPEEGYIYDIYDPDTFFMFRMA